jgi:hypothetical protein
MRDPREAAGRIRCALDEGAMPDYFDRALEPSARRSLMEILQ